MLALSIDSKACQDAWKIRKAKQNSLWGKNLSSGRGSLIARNGHHFSLTLSLTEHEEKEKKKDAVDQIVLGAFCLFLANGPIV